MTKFREREIMSKILSKYISTSDYLKTLKTRLVLSATNGGVSLFATGIGALGNLSVFYKKLNY